jgi:hypothetical protein
VPQATGGSAIVDGLPEVPRAQPDAVAAAVQLFVAVVRRSSEVRSPSDELPPSGEVSNCPRIEKGNRISRRVMKKKKRPLLGGGAISLDDGDGR